MENKNGKYFDLYDSKIQFYASSFRKIHFCVNKLKNHSAIPGSAGILPTFGGRDARAPRVLSSFGVVEKAMTVT